MNGLPVEMLWRIFGTIFEENPADLYRCRAVCRDWKTSIDGYIPTLYKIWHRACVRDIPEDCIDNIVASRFPLAALPWKDSYWKTAQLPHIPRTVHQTWKNLQEFDTHKCDVTEITADPNKPNLGCANFGISGKYLAVSQMVGLYKHRTKVYKLADMTRPIQVYPLDCLQLAFYTAGDRELILLLATTTARKFRVMGEFLKNNKTKRLRLPCNDKSECEYWTVIGNECFAYDKLHFIHYVFSDGSFKISTKVHVPKQSYFDETACIMELRMNGSELLAIAEFMRTNLSPEEQKKNPVYYDYHCRNLCIYRYNISRGSNGSLDFSPHPTNFIQIITNRYDDGWESTGANRIEHLPMDIRLYPIRFEFVRWLNIAFENIINFIYLLIHGDHVFAGTKNGKIIIFHHWTVEEMIRDFTNKNLTVKKYSEINLGNITRHLAPIGIVYTNSKLRIIVRDCSDHFAINLPLKF